MPVVFLALFARADYEVIDDATALARGGASGGDEIRKFDNGDNSFDLVHIFTNTSSSATFSIPFTSKLSPSSLRLLVVGGGGSGGAAMAGGGGGGGVIARDAFEMPLGSSATVTVGAGALAVVPFSTNVNNSTANKYAHPAGMRGGDSVFAIAGGETHTAYGGRGGKGWSDGSPQGDAPFGSGGGGSGQNTGATTGTEGQGNNGGAGLSGSSATGACGGGGGGAGSAGGAGTRASDANNVTGGKGGDGIANDILGEVLYYGAGGGGGACWGTNNSARAVGGLGGMSGDGTGNWGKGANRYVTPGNTSSGVDKPVAGQDGFGGGGGGGTYWDNGSNVKANSGAKGGDGVVIVRYTVAALPVSQNGATEIDVGDEKVYVFSDATTPGQLVLDSAAKVWVLAVGGGGAGANPGAAGMSVGGAGGGGAGGFVENETLMLQPGTYTINVGAGGVSPSAQGAGGDGQPSSIVLGSAEIVKALGGGGGGIRGAGNAGGSGGGGSKVSNTAGAGDGGSGYSGQGNAGGQGVSNQAGAGGGGAGGSGERAETVGVGAPGGSGKASSITGTETYYAAGGGGGSRSGTGGNGGIGASADDMLGGVGGGASAATSGRDGTGSGGGGGRLNEAGGSGGSGVVIIRVKKVMPSKPPAQVEFDYDGTEHLIYEGSEAVTIRRGTATFSDISVKDVGEYTFTVSLNSGYDCWADGTTGDATCVVTVNPPTLEIISLTINDWQEGETPSTPVLETNIALSEDDYAFVYSTSSTGPWSESVPTAAGSYYLTAQIGSSPNFMPPTAPVPVVPFRIWGWDGDDKYLDCLGYHAKLTISGYTGAETLTDFPMLVKVSENSPNGFHYKHTNGKFATGGIDALDLRFIDSATGDILPFEIEKWDESGESLIWVKVPAYAGGKSITMCWGELVDKEIPATPASTDVWTSFSGVWHMGEEIASAAAGTTNSKDATANANDAKPSKGSNTASANLNQMVSTEGMVGNARVNSSVTSVSGGTYLKLTKNYTFNGVFTYSGWFKMRTKDNYPRLGGNRTADGSGNNGTTSTGWSIESAQNRDDRFGLRYTGTNLVYCTYSDMHLLDGWHYLSFVFNGASVQFFADGVAASDVIATANSVADTANPIAFGNVSNGSSYSLDGAYDEIRLMPTVPSADWVAADYGQVADPAYYSWGQTLVTPNSCFKNRWIVEPSISKTEWPQSSPHGVVSPGEAAYGEPYFTFKPTIGDTLTNDYPTAVGDYEFGVFVDAGSETAGTRSWEGLSWDGGVVSITAETSYQGLAGEESDSTASGRVLLANDDPASGDDTKVVGQNYDYTDPSGAVYWVHEGDAAVVIYPKMRAGTTHTLMHNGLVGSLCGSTNLWYLEDVRLGNVYPRNMAIPDTENFLPCSPTAGADGAEAVNVMLRNIEGAAIYSPCYTNGIGTIYFDAVNEANSEDGAGFALVVEVATNCVGYFDYRIPSDENVYKYIPGQETHTEIGEGVIETNWVEAVVERFGYADWQPVEMLPFVVTNGVVESSDPTRELALAMNAGGSDRNFYRVAVPLNYRCPARFRIRRATADSTKSADSWFILVDNVIASFPSMRADLGPCGMYDPRRDGKLTLGQECAWSVPFPSVADEEVFARAKPEYYVNPGYDADPSEFVTSARMHYRWRYLEQKVEGWRTVTLDPANGFRSSAPLVLPVGLQGDVEYWYDLKLNAPFYAYYDYSGVGVGLGGLYTENVSSVVNASQDGINQSCGTNWFVRLREGQSDYEGVRLVVRRNPANGGSPVEERIEMDVVGNHIWRGYLKTSVETNYWGESLYSSVDFRFEAYNRQVPGADEMATNLVCWKIRGDATRLPISETMTECTTNDWANAPYDTTTGYWLFQIDDGTKSITTVHADYQNFNAWNDANKGGVFVGSSTADDEKAGASARSVGLSEDFEGWGDMPATNIYWIESFSSQVAQEYADYVTFPSWTTDNGWTAGQGMRVCQKYRMPKVGHALQMEGQGRGYLQYVDSAVVPRGLESVSFSARLGQDVDFDDVAYYEGEHKQSMTNYTFMTRSAFDLNENKNFSGNAALSVFAYYRPKVGCYEARWEWTSTNANTSTRNTCLSLYRWNFKQGKKVKTMLGVWTNKMFNSDVKAKAISASAKFTPIMISVTNENNGVTLVTALIKNNYGDSTTQVPKVTTNSVDGTVTTNMTYQRNAWWGNTGESLVGNFSDDGQWLGISYRDASPDALRCGTYGVLPTNCEGFFGHPETYAPVPWDKSMFEKSSIPAELPVNTPLTPTHYNNKGQEDSWDYSIMKRHLSPVNPATARSCFADEGAEDYWVIGDGRMVFTNNTDYALRGIRAHVYPQELNVYVSPAGKTDWRLVATTNFTGFGSSTKAGQSCTFKVYETANCAVKIAAAGDVGDPRTDIVIDDVVLRQWRGADWSDANAVEAYVPNYGDEQTYHTNFTFTSGWITNETVLLSAKRTAPGTPCGIRSPLFDGDGPSGGKRRGTGLGMLSFTYENAQPSVNLLLQVATNVTAGTVSTVDRLDDELWTTVTNFEFSALSAAELKSGVRSCYVGLHGVTGVMRLIMDPEVVNSVTNVTDVSKFGDVYITSVYCRDEPNLDPTCWWGWNLRTLGQDASTGMDLEKRMYLPDFARTDSSMVGMSLALNNSTNAVDNKRDADVYLQHVPFLQTPEFGTNIVGEVSFKARKYDGDSSQPALVTLYGSKSAGGAWKWLANFVVSNSTFASYSFKTDQNDNYRAFRLAVVGVDGVETDDLEGQKTLPGYDRSGNLVYDYTTPVRVLIDEAAVSEAVRASMAFRNVAPFRNRSEDEALNRDTYVEDVTGEQWQPMCNESWGVQCEVIAAQLPDEIDFERTPKVKLYWMVGEYPWGFDNWRTNSAAKSAWLAPATGTNLIYRSSYLKTPDAIVPPETAPGTVVQFGLEVIWYPVGSDAPATNRLNSSGLGWVNPEWYDPVDKNAGKGDFSAYTILDTVAPHWAWINEVNIFGEYDNSYNNSDKNCQYVEVAVPAEADIDGWYVQLLTPQRSVGLVVTNTLGVFGRGDGNKYLSSMKEITTYNASNMSFRVLASEESYLSGRLDRSKGEADAAWNPGSTAVLKKSGEIDPVESFGLRLVRSSGVVEHEVVVRGLNWWKQFDDEDASESPTNYVNYLNQKTTPPKYFWVGCDDDAGKDWSLSVISARGGETNDWVNSVDRTPGRINVGQVIDPDHPTPNGTSIIVYANLDNDFGHIYHVLDDGSVTNASQIIFIKRGSDRGTNIVYQVDPWYEVGTVTTNGRPAAASLVDASTRTYVLEGVGLGASNNVTVVASAKVKDSLTAAGVDPLYREAILDWLTKHKDAYGNDWANPDADEIRRADFVDWSKWRVDPTAEADSQLTVTEMYWLDIDPTMGDLALVGGTTDFNPSVMKADGSTNMTIDVFMMVTNRTADASSAWYGTNWTPYVLRGMEPDSTSWQFVQEGRGRWTNETFKIRGVLDNGKTSLARDGNNWIPLRWFVFMPDSFDPVTKKTRVEIKDPFGGDTPAYAEGWHAEEHVPVFLDWNLDKEFNMFFNAVPLKKENFYND